MRKNLTGTMITFLLMVSIVVGGLVGCTRVAPTADNESKVDVATESPTVSPEPTTPSDIPSDATEQMNSLTAFIQSFNGAAPECVQLYNCTFTFEADGTCLVTAESGQQICIHFAPDNTVALFVPANGEITDMIAIARTGLMLLQGENTNMPEEKQAIAASVKETIANLSKKFDNIEFDTKLDASLPDYSDFFEKAENILAGFERAN